VKRLAPTVLTSIFILASCAGERGAPPKARIEEVVVHKVEMGETWGSIAADFYGDADRGGELAVYNGTEPENEPVAGTGVRVPLAEADIEYFEKRLDATDAYNLGLELASKGDFGEAVEQFGKALRICPFFPDASFNLSVTYQKLGLHGKAAEELEMLVEKVPRNPVYLFALGSSLFHTGDLEGARRYFLESLSADAGYLKALYSLAVVCEKTGRKDEAVRHWNEYLRRAQDGEWAKEAKTRLGRLTEGGGG